MRFFWSVGCVLCLSWENVRLFRKRPLTSHHTQQRINHAYAGVIDGPREMPMCRSDSAENVIGNFATFLVTHSRRRSLFTGSPTYNIKFVQCERGGKNLMNFLSTFFLLRLISKSWK